ncbi:YqeG family HAD IIIA-type phosphatase [Desulfoscipio gibsoniae]|uniref:HAD phosphatase subfamily IIIA n=1 Tax=Desulfoscipio gibsoniae DSM 7213 TaxID=767817 RepID=R4KHJ5_9FIRM|nr:YqeG family HAD IIIA-type phosphatase [Desulfoscipio gibsoniae]AGL02069.1 HAD phosphatase subfamily IIIA [Desulfoscipio gibsoniae DSM 7213]
MLRIFYPNMYVPSILDINPEELQKQGITAILLDLDNTIVPRDRDKFSPEIKAWLTGMLQKGFKLCIVSNNGTSRVNTLAGPLKIPCVVRAVKPMRQAFRRALELLDATPEETVVVGDQIFTDIWGGNRLGMFTILVVPMPGKEFWVTKLINRRLEKVVLARISRLVSHKDKQYYVR